MALSYHRLYYNFGNVLLKHYQRTMVSRQVVIVFREVACGFHRPHGHGQVVALILSQSGRVVLSLTFGTVVLQT